MKNEMQRKERREYEKCEAFLKKIINTYFEKCIEILKTKEGNITEKFNAYNTTWRVFSGKYNYAYKKRKQAFLLIDAFENAILKGHEKIKQSKCDNKTKLLMLACIYPIQGRSAWYYFFRDFSVRFGYIWEKYIERKRAQHKTLMTATVTEKKEV